MSASEDQAAKLDERLTNCLNLTNCDNNGVEAAAVVDSFFGPQATYIDGTVFGGPQAILIKIT